MLLRLPHIVPRRIHRYTTATEEPFLEVVHFLSREPDRCIYCWISILPESSIATNCNVPLHVDFHSGGFVTGQLAEQAPFCSMMGRRPSAMVITAYYHMGPLQKCPSAIQNAEDVVKACIEEHSVTTTLSDASLLA